MMGRIDTRLPWGFLILSTAALLILSSTSATPIPSKPSSVIDGSSFGGNLTSSTLLGKEDMASVSKSNQVLDKSPSESKNISEVSGTPSPSLMGSAVNTTSSGESSTELDQSIPSLTKVETLVEKLGERAKWSLEPLKNAFHAFECSIGFCNSETSTPDTTSGDSGNSSQSSPPKSKVETNVPSTSTSSPPTSTSAATTTPIPSTTSAPSTTSEIPK